MNRQPKSSLETPVINTDLAYDIGVIGVGRLVNVIGISSAQAHFEQVRRNKELLRSQGISMGMSGPATFSPGLTS